MKGITALGTESARVIEVIETRALKGDGSKDNPVRYTFQYWDKEGNLLAEKDYKDDDLNIGEGQLNNKVRICDCTRNKTKELVEELRRREGVKIYGVKPDEKLEVEIEGPAILLVVMD